jgi:hypothetical protein
LKKIAISIPLVSVLNSIFILFEYETVCYQPEDDRGLIHENLLGVCEDGEKAFNGHTSIRCGFNKRISSSFVYIIRMMEGYEVFRGLKLLIVHQLVPFILTFFFLYKNYR